MRLRDRLVLVGGIVGPEAVLKMFDADEEDIEMLAVVEAELRKARRDEKHD